MIIGNIGYEIEIANNLTAAGHAVFGIHGSDDCKFRYDTTCVDFFEKVAFNSTTGEFDGTTLASIDTIIYTRDVWPALPSTAFLQIASWVEQGGYLITESNTCQDVFGGMNLFSGASCEFKSVKLAGNCPRNQDGVEVSEAVVSFTPAWGPQPMNYSDCARAEFFNPISDLSPLISTVLAKVNDIDVVTAARAGKVPCFLFCLVFVRTPTTRYCSSTFQFSNPTFQSPPIIPLSRVSSVRGLSFFGSWTGLKCGANLEGAEAWKSGPLMERETSSTACLISPLVSVATATAALETASSSKMPACGKTRTRAYRRLQQQPLQQGPHRNPSQNQNPSQSPSQ